MTEFYQLNRPKLFFATRFCLLIFGLLALIPVFLVTYYDSGSFLEVVAYSAAFVIVLTSFVMMLVMITENYRFERKKRTFVRSPLSEFFIVYGFRPVLLYEDSRWLFTQEAMEGYFRGFRVLADVDSVRPGQLRFDFFAESASDKRKHPGPKKNKGLTGQFRENRIRFEGGVASITFTISRIRSGTELMYRLHAFTDQLTSGGFAPSFDETDQDMYMAPV